MHNSKQPFSFLNTKKAPTNKTTQIDFFFKKDPRLAQLEEKRRGGIHIKGSFYQKQRSSPIDETQSVTISEAYQQIINLKKKLDKQSLQDNGSVIRGFTPSHPITPMSQTLEHHVRENTSENDRSLISPILTAAK